MYFRSLMATAAVLLSTSEVASDLPRQPTEKWVVHFDDAQCVAQRNYGSEKEPLYLLLKQPPLGDVMQLSIVRPAQFGGGKEVEGSLEFAGSPRQKVSVLKFTPKKEKLGVFMINLPLNQFTPARTARALRVRTERLDESLALVDVAALLKVMSTCVSDLRKVWNVKGSEAAAGVERKDTEGLLRGLFTADDFPWQAIENMRSGTVKIALLVNELGKVADCSVVQTSGVAVLDAQSCIVVRQRAKFTPATGEDGMPIKQAFIQSITWRVE